MNNPHNCGSKPRRGLRRLRALAALGIDRLPTLCLLCSGHSDRGYNLCAACEAELPRVRSACLRCGLATSGQDRACTHCLRQTPVFDRCRPALRYEGPVRQLIADFKFRQRLEAGYALARLLAATIEADHDSERPDWLLPVPLHAGRERERGFNQAREIARALSSRCDIPVARGWARRRRATAAQAGQPSRRARRNNLRGAFEVERSRMPARVVSVALVDDVVTTMATADSLSRCLRQAGVAHIELWCLARAE